MNKYPKLEYYYTLEQQLPLIESVDLLKGEFDELVKSHRNIKNFPFSFPEQIKHWLDNRGSGAEAALLDNVDKSKCGICYNSYSSSSGRMLRGIRREKKAEKEAEDNRKMNEFMEQEERKMQEEQKRLKAIEEEISREGEDDGGVYRYGGSRRRTKNKKVKKKVKRSKNKKVKNKVKRSKRKRSKIKRKSI